LQTNDSQDVQSTAAEIKQLDPKSTLPGRMVGASLLKMGVDAANRQELRASLQRLRSSGRRGRP